MRVPRPSSPVDDKLQWYEVAFEHDLAMREGRYEAALHWLVIALKRLEQESRPPSLADIATLVGRRPGTVRRIVRRYNERGPDDFIARSQRQPSSPGRKRKLSDAQVQRIRVMLSTGRQKNGDAWTAAAVRSEIYRRFRVYVSRTTAWRYIKRARREGQGGLFAGG